MIPEDPQHDRLATLRELSRRGSQETVRRYRRMYALMVATILLSALFVALCLAFIPQHNC